MQSKEVTIIGNGIVGVCCALSLQEAGFKVTILTNHTLEKRCSYGNAGILAAWSCVPAAMPGVLQSLPALLRDPESPLTIRRNYLGKLVPWGIRFARLTNEEQVHKAAEAMFALHHNSVKLYEALLRQTKLQHLMQPSNFIYAFEDETKLHLDTLEWQLRETRDADIQRLSGDELREIEPAIASHYTAAISLGPQAHILNPGRLVDALTDHFQQAGGQVITANVQAIRPQEQTVRLLTDQGERQVERLVVAAGSWSPQLLEPLGLTLPLASERGYHCTFQNPDVTVNNTVMDMRSKFAATSMEQGLRCAGMAEFSAIESTPDKKRLTVLKQRSKRMFPDLNTEHVSTWVGSRPTFPDSLPVIDQHSDYPNILMAFGHSHTGLTAAPMTGNLIKQILCQEKIKTNLKPYQAQRFKHLFFTAGE